jgi:hypothetical protein
MAAAWEADAEALRAARPRHLLFLCVANSALATPALVVDGQVRSAGRVLTPEAIKELLGR